MLQVVTGQVILYHKFHKGYLLLINKLHLIQIIVQTILCIFDAILMV